MHLIDSISDLCVCVCVVPNKRKSFLMEIE
jgi:hypothetical protein